jgi:hypothetical protein
LVAFTLSAFVNNRSLHGSIIGSWNNSPLIAEALAFCQDLDHSALWDILDFLSSSPSNFNSVSEIVNLAKQYFDSELVSLLNFSLQIRFYSARIAYYRNLLNSSQSEVKCRNSIVKNIKEIEFCESEFLPFEPVFGLGNISLVLYVDVSTQNWKETLRNLQSEESRIRFFPASRPISQNKDFISDVNQSLVPVSNNHPSSIFVGTRLTIKMKGCLSCNNSIDHNNSRIPDCCCHQK